MASPTSIGIIIDAEINKTYTRLAQDLTNMLCYEHKDQGECNHDYCDGLRMAINQITMRITNG